MDISFTNLSAVVPDDWRDQSTLIFAMPPLELKADLALGAKAEGSLANVAIVWELDSSSLPKRYLEGRLDGLCKALSQFKIIEEVAAFQDTEDVCVTYSFHAGRPMTQLMFCRRLGERIVTITGTAATEVFSQARQKFREIASSIQVSG